MLACRVVEPDDWCRRCGCQGVPGEDGEQGVAARAVRVAPYHAGAHRAPLPLQGVLARVASGHHRCGAAGGPKISRAGLRWGLVGIVVGHLSMARVAEGLGVAWNTANDAVLAEGRRLLIEDPTRLDGVKVVGVDEHVWRHTRRGDKYVTVIIDLTPVRDGTGPSRLLDVVEGRSKKAFKDWLAERDQAWRDGIEVVAMGSGFAGFKTATTEELPDAVTVMDPFHVHPVGRGRSR